MVSSLQKNMCFT